MKSEIAIIVNALSKRTETNSNAPMFKKTFDSFKKKYGVSILEAPIYVIINGGICRFMLTQGVYSKRCKRSAGRKFETAGYYPVAHAYGRFTTKFQTIEEK